MSTSEFLVMRQVLLGRLSPDAVLPSKTDTYEMLRDLRDAIVDYNICTIAEDLDLKYDDLMNRMAGNIVLINEVVNRLDSKGIPWRDTFGRIGLPTQHPWGMLPNQTITWSAIIAVQRQGEKNAEKEIENDN